jgi:hypothetical protein
MKLFAKLKLLLKNELLHEYIIKELLLTFLFKTMIDKLISFLTDNLECQWLMPLILVT